jgi:hypothetical protein
MMKSSVYWQSPFVDVFKMFEVLEMKAIDKQGDVTIV